MIFHKPLYRAKASSAGFTVIEACVALGIIGIGVASSIGALTKVNAFASMSRNATGAYTVVNNEIDAILSNGPFNPQKTNEVSGTPQVPPELQLGTRTRTVPIYREPVTITWTYANAAARTGATGFVAGNIGKLAFQTDNGTYWKLASTAPAWVTDPGGVIVTGELETVVTNVPTTYNGQTLYMYRATVTVGYQYLKGGPIWSVARNRWEYQYSMSTLRVSDI